MCFKNKLSRVIQIVLAFLLNDSDTEQVTFLCLGEDITHIQKEWWQCQQPQSAISSRTLFIFDSNFTSSVNSSCFFLAFSSLLDNCVFQFSFKSISIANIFQLKKFNVAGVYYWEQLQKALLFLHNQSDRCPVTNL